MEHVAKRPYYQRINGMVFPGMFSPKCIREAFEYKPTSEDVFAVTFSKCGTTWMQNILIYIFRKGQPLDKPTDFLIASPFIDMIGEDGVKAMPRPGAIKTHLPYTSMPYSPEAKYIFVIRNPLDTCVSLFYHTRMHLGYNYNGTFDDFFEIFLAGEVEFTGYFEHLLSWYPHRNDKNVFYTTYEDMKKDIKAVVRKVAEFLGEEYVEAVKKEEIMNNIVEFSSFKYMQDNFTDVYDTKKLKDAIASGIELPEGLKYFAERTPLRDDNSPKMEFVRKGVVGDWRNHFSAEQLRRMKEKFIEKTEGTDIPNWWPNLFQEQ